MRESDLKIPGKPMVYVDMDGVLVNLFEHIANAHDLMKYTSLTEEQWKKYFADKDAEEVFASVDPFPISNKILELVTDIFGKYTILSRPLQYDEAGSIRGKNRWLDTHVNIKPVKRIFETDKWKYAVQPDGTPNILIDDHRTNITLWREHGGIGVKFQSDENTLNELKRQLIAAREKFQ